MATKTVAPTAMPTIAPALSAPDFELLPLGKTGRLISDRGGLNIGEN
jgi:hypothetical protein